jgi:hypothetical protein
MTYKNRQSQTGRYEDDQSYDMSNPGGKRSKEVIKRQKARPNLLKMAGRESKLFISAERRTRG